MAQSYCLRCSRWPPFPGITAEGWVLHPGMDALLFEGMKGVGNWIWKGVNGDAFFLLPVGRKVACVSAYVCSPVCIYKYSGRCVCVCAHVHIRGLYQMSSSITFHLILESFTWTQSSLIWLVQLAKLASLPKESHLSFHEYWSSCLGGKYFYYWAIFPLPKASF